MPVDIDTRTWVLAVLGGVGIAWYYWCIIRIGWWPPGAAPTEYQRFQISSITIISTTLATSVGLVLGLYGFSERATVTATSAKEARSHTEEIQKQTGAEMFSPGFPRDLGGGPGGPSAPLAARAASVISNAKQAEEKSTTVDKNAQGLAHSSKPSLFQWASLTLYLASVVLALVCWTLKSGDGGAGQPPPRDQVIVNLAKSFLGVIAGAVSALLATHN